MSSGLDISFLRNSHPRHTGPYLHKLALSSNDNIAISEELIQAIAAEFQPPRVYKLWLCACPDETALAFGLRQTTSIYVRSVSIKALYGWFRTDKCGHVWHALGGTDGIAALLATFSVNHIKMFSKYVGQCSTSEPARDERQELLTDLMQVLASAVIHGSTNARNPDRRPLLDAYVPLVYGCRPAFRDSWINHEALPELEMYKVMATNTDWYQQQCLKLAARGDEKLWIYKPLLTALPPGPSTEYPTIPKSMVFAAKVLQTFVDNGVRLRKDKWHQGRLGSAMLTIIRRLARPEIPLAFALQTVRLMSMCASEHIVAESRAFGVKYQEYLKDITRLWQRNPDAFEPVLSNLFPTFQNDIESLIEATKAAKLVCRYRRFTWQLSSQLNIDAEGSDQLRFVICSIPRKLFTMLPKDESRDLLERFILAKGDDMKWMTGKIIYEPSFHQANPDLDLLRLQLTADNHLRLEDGTEKASKYRLMAERERDPDLRIHWLTAAASMAVGSGSLDLVQDVLIWARRYNRDPNVSAFYGSWNMLRGDETLRLLSGIPENLGIDTDVASMAANVRKGNGIALLLLETATMCQKEPGFYANHWSEVQRLLVDIVQVRLDSTKRLHKLLGMSEDQVFAVVWNDTLSSLLKAEKLGLDERNQSLQYHELDGPLAVWGTGEIMVRDPSIASLRFVNELAAQRHELWRQHRSTVHPAVTALQAPWTQGLPIQALDVITVEGILPGGSLPFLEQRAREVVFLPREYAQRPVPEDLETKAAIGCFVDDYARALGIYLSWCEEKELRRRREFAWAYATSSLSEGRLSVPEARAYWGNIFTNAGAPPSKFESVSFPERSPPALPLPDKADDLQEWNPDPIVNPVVSEERKLEPMCLDCFTHPTYGKDTTYSLDTPCPKIGPIRVPDFWDLERFGPMIPPDAMEAFIAASLLLVDAKSKADSKILSAPFPPTAPRFPALFLDSDFIESQRDFDAFPSKLLKDTPPALLEQLAAKLVSDICASDDPSPALVRWGFRTVKLLACSDKPGFAVPYVVKTLVGLPEQSSWHRILLHPGVLKRLSAEESKALVTGLAQVIFESARAHAAKDQISRAPGVDSSEDIEMTSAPFIKVTTVKLLAQLMNPAGFIDEGSSVGVLVNLFKESGHVDIRVAAVESLLAILRSTNDRNIEASVMNALEEHIVPIAADFNERAPMTEQKWKKCGESSEMPQVTFNIDAPIRSALLRYMELQSDAAQKRGLIERLFLPLVRQSVDNIARWTALFLRVNNAANLESLLPPAFGNHDLLSWLLSRSTEHMPVKAFKIFSDQAIIAANPPPAMKAFIKRIEDNKPRTEAFETLLRFSKSGALAMSRTTVSDLLKQGKFATAEDAAANDLLTPEHLQSHERRVIDNLLTCYDDSIERWQRYTRGYVTPVRMEDKRRLRWHQYCRPLVQYMIERVESQRTPQWQQDPNRKPARLPDMFPMRLWLLTYPSIPRPDGSKDDEQREDFARELREAIAGLAASGRPYHAPFKLVAEAAKGCYEEDWAFIAWRLGALDDEQVHRQMTVEELLRIELADSLLQGAKKPLKSQKELLGVEIMLRQWRNSFDEDVRDRGIATSLMLSEKAKTNREALPVFLHGMIG